MSFKPHECYYHFFALIGDELLEVGALESSLKALRYAAEGQGHDLAGVPVEAWFRSGEGERHFGFFVGDTSSMVAEGWTRAI